MVFVFIVIGVALTISLANNQTLVTQTTTLMEQATLTNGSTTRLTNGIIVGVTSIVNATNASQSQPAANYTVIQPQSIYFTGGRTGLFNVTYSYNNVPDRASNTMVTLVTLMFVLTLIAGIIYYLDGFKELMGFSK